MKSESKPLIGSSDSSICLSNSYSLNMCYLEMPYLGSRAICAAVAFSHFIPWYWNLLFIHFSVPLIFMMPNIPLSSCLYMIVAHFGTGNAWYWVSLYVIFWMEMMLALLYLPLLHHHFHPPLHFHFIIITWVNDFIIFHACISFSEADITIQLSSNINLSRK